MNELTIFPDRGKKLVKERAHNVNSYPKLGSIIIFLLIFIPIVHLIFYGIFKFTEPAVSLFLFPACWIPASFACLFLSYNEYWDDKP